MDWLGIAATYCWRLCIFAGRFPRPRLHEGPEDKVDIAIERASAIDRGNGAKAAGEPEVAKPCMKHQPRVPRRSREAWPELWARLDRALVMLTTGRAERADGRCLISGALPTDRAPSGWCRRRGGMGHHSVWAGVEWRAVSAMMFRYTAFRDAGGAVGQA